METNFKTLGTGALVTMSLMSFNHKILEEVSMSKKATEGTYEIVENKYSADLTQYIVGGFSGTASVISVRVSDNLTVDEQFRVSLG